MVFNTNPPLLPEWVRNYPEPFLRYKLGEISLGKTLKVWCLKSLDLPEHIVTRVEYGTSYYRWRDIQVAAMRVHGGPKGLERFMLKRCWRSRGYVERAFERIRNGTYMTSNKSGGESSSEGTHSTQIAQLFSQIVNTSRQAMNGSVSVAHGTQNVAHGTQNVAHGTQNVAHGTQNVAHGSGQIGHGLANVQHGEGRGTRSSLSAGHASGHVPNGSEASSSFHSARQVQVQVPHASRQVAHASRQVQREPVQLAHGSRQVAIVHALWPFINGSVQTAHGSALNANSSHATAQHTSRTSTGNAHASTEAGESSTTSGRSAQYVFSSSSESSMEID